MTDMSRSRSPARGLVGCAMLLVAAATAAYAAVPRSVGTDPCAPTGPPPSYTMGPINVEGIHYGGIPSEPCIGVGPNHIFCLGPGDVRIFDKATGALLRSQCQNVFFQTSTGCLSGANPVFGDGGGLIDPDCYYDRIARRFVAVCFSLTGTGGKHVQTHLHLAVSQGPDPMGPWHVYHMNTTRNSIAPAFTYIPDRPSLGGSLDKIGISAHMVSYDGGPEFTMFHVMDRDSAYAGLLADPLNPDSINHYDRADFDTMAFNFRLGRNADADPRLHALSVGGVARNAAMYRSITGPASACVVSDTTTLPLGYPTPYGVGRRAPQFSTSIKLANTIDTMPNLSALWVRNGTLSMAWHQPWVLCPPDTVNVLHLFRAKVIPSGGGGSSLVALMDTLYGQPGMWYAFPAICDDSLGRLYLGFLASSPAIYPSSFVTGKLPGETGFEINPTLAKAGVKAWTRADGGGTLGRWGDFTNIDLDESVSPPVAYFAGQWGKAGTTTLVDSLGTWIRNFYFAANVGVPGGAPVPGNLLIDGVWPNPTHAEVKIQVSLARPGQLKLEVDDVSGRRVRKLASRALAAGSHVFVWDGRDDSGARAGAGVYLCRASDGTSVSRRKFTLLR